MKSDIVIALEDIQINGILNKPERTKGFVIFVHGSGSSRHSPRNGYVAKILNEAGIATLLCDLLTPEEDLSVENRFNIGLLADRVVAITRFFQKEGDYADLHTGYFGASTGAAAALVAASKAGGKIRAIVSRGGRPDLAGNVLPHIKTPTLLIVGGDDDACIPLNESAYRHLYGIKKLEIVSGATHLFEEPGALEKVAFLARDWFLRYLC